MKTKFHRLFIALAWLALSTLNIQLSTVFAQGTAFTYQGRLQNNGSPASGTYNLTFALFNTNISGVAIAGPVTNTAVNVSNGLFTVLIDFGSGAFTGASNWLEIGIESNGITTFTILTPRQQLTPAPYAIYASKSATALTANSASTVVNGVVTTGTYSDPAWLTSLSGGKIAGDILGSAAGFNGSLGGDVTGHQGTTTVGKIQNVPVSGNLPSSGQVLVFNGSAWAPTTSSYVDLVSSQMVGGTKTFSSTIIGDISGNAATVTHGVYDNGIYTDPAWITSLAGGKIAGDILGSAAGFNGSLGGDVTGHQGTTTVGKIQNFPVSANPPISGQVLVYSGSAWVPTSQNSAWLLTGNAGTTPGVNFLGTTDMQPLELHVNGLRTLRLEPTSDTPNVIGGYSGNYVQPGLPGVTIGGGGTLIGGQPNIVTNNGYYATIAGGYRNEVGGYGGAVLGGSVNFDGGDFGVIGGGQFNTISSGYSFIGGGFYNSIQSGSDYSAIGGGYENTIQTNAYYSTIGGGGQNTIYENAIGSTIGGGINNTADGSHATVPGGTDNEANGNYSFAAGAQARAFNNGSFVWGDGSAETDTTLDYQFLVRASGGVVFLSSSGNTGVSLAAGSGSWSSLSDRNAKDSFAPVAAQQLLAKVAELPITQWSYRTEQGVRHIGPMAQDFYAAFGVGEDDKHIATVDEEGVALAAIQGLNQKLNEKDAKIKELESRLEKLEQLMTDKLGGAK